MAVVGARPATGFGVFGRRSRPRRRSVQRSRGRRIGAGRRARPVNVTGMLVTVLVAASLCFFYLSQSSHVAATGYEINVLETAIQQARQDQQQLVLAIGEARSPSRVEAQARDSLGLQPIPQERIAFAQPSSASTK